MRKKLKLESLKEKKKKKKEGKYYIHVFRKGNKGEKYRRENDKGF
jgi:hypothetical protein